MEFYHLSLAHEVQSAKVELPASKSISNRLLILQHLYQQTNSPMVSNFSLSNDTVVMQRALESIVNKELNINVEDCGTAMRFLVSVLAITEGDWTIYGTNQMHTRTLAPLIKALRDLGADITCLENEGYPPLRFRGKKLQGGSVNIDASISSQYISSLMMIAPKLEQGLRLVLEGDVASQPYIQLTYELMHIYGVDVSKCQVVSASGEPLLIQSKLSSKLNQY
ncbi:MAG: hypothetical protein HYZ42_06925, partial [Bacteroidetes bacterium]|nr:hypothetical protein [Bacteroidota bacterium]